MDAARVTSAEAEASAARGGSGRSRRSRRQGKEAVVGGYSGGVEAATVGRQTVTTVAVATFAAAVNWGGGMLCGSWTSPSRGRR